MTTLVTDRRSIEACEDPEGERLCEQVAAEYLDVRIRMARALSRMPLPPGKRIGFLAPSGALLVTLSDLCHRQLGLEIPTLEEATRVWNDPAREPEVGQL